MTCKVLPTYGALAGGVLATNRYGGPEYRRDDQTQTIRWYLYHGLGSVVGEVDTASNVTASLKPRQGSVSGYDVYGLVRAGDSGTSRHKFVGSLGHTSEDETGLIYPGSARVFDMRARWMDPSLGRFISEDPDGRSVSLYAYAASNPVNRLDADGKVDVTVAQHQALIRNALFMRSVLMFCPAFRVFLLGVGYLIVASLLTLAVMPLVLLTGHGGVALGALGEALATTASMVRDAMLLKVPQVPAPLTQAALFMAGYSAYLDFVMTILAIEVENNGVVFPF